MEIVKTECTMCLDHGMDTKLFFLPFLLFQKGIRGGVDKCSVLV